MDKNVLLIDKDPDVIELISILLTAEGYQPIIAEKPFSLGQVRTVAPLLIVVHNGLDNRGIDICRQLKTDQELSAIPLLLTSTHPNLPELAKSYGADCHILKPFDIAEFSALVNRCVTARSD